MQENHLEAQPAPKAQSGPKAQWEPMRLTPVGNLGAVMQNKVGSFLDGGGGTAMKLK